MKTGENKNKRVEQPKQLKEAKNDRWMKIRCTFNAGYECVQNQYIRIREHVR